MRGVLGTITQYAQRCPIFRTGGEKLFYPNIAAERAKRKMSVDALAEALGVTRKTIYNWENNGKIPQKQLEKMADLFNCPTDYLLETEVEN